MSPVTIQIDWPAVRQMMLTANDTLVDASQVGETRLEAILTLEQAESAQRCLRALHQGLQWSSTYQTKLSSANPSGSVRHFFIDDDQIIGIFRDCFGLGNDGPAFHYPTTLDEYLILQAEGRRLMVADLVLEKPNRRLVNRWGKAQQSMFLRDLVFPGFMGILAHYTGLFEELDQQEYLDGLQGMGLSRRSQQAVALAEHNGLLTRQLLFDVLHDTEKANRFLAQTPPLALFCDANSPFNIEISQTGQLLPLEYGLQTTPTTSLGFGNVLA